MSTGEVILVVEDEAPQRRLIAGLLERAGHDVRQAGGVAEALEAIRREPPALVLCDWRLPDGEGGEILDWVKEHEPGCAFVVITAYGSISHAVDAVRRGADDYLAKPFEGDALLLAVGKALRLRRVVEENLELRREVGERDRFGPLLGRSPAMQRLYRTIEKVAATDATVLITGESGTGKEVVARTLHARSARAGGPFVAVSCGAIPETLIESELFGHEKGAFTGAHRRRVGRFEEASGGTLFLDEIQSLPLALQPALLRALQERTVTRVGGSGEVPCDVRVLAATNRDLAELVAAGEFREDLYYRLNVVPIEVPPLRERREDIAALAEAFRARAARRHGVVTQPVPPAVLRHFMSYHWPGNVRELANMVERLVLLAEGGRLREADLPEDVRLPAGKGTGRFRLPPGGIRWDDLEGDLLRQALERSGGNRAAAARLLGLGYKAFLYRLEKHGLA